MNTPAIQSALDNLVDAIRAELRDEFMTALGGSPNRKGSKVRKRAAAPRAMARKTGPKGGKRTAAELEKLTVRTLAAIKKGPGQRSEELATTLGVSTKELVLPIGRLFAQKAIRTTGQRRGMKYFAK